MNSIGLSGSLEVDRVFGASIPLPSKRTQEGDGSRFSKISYLPERECIKVALKNGHIARIKTLAMPLEKIASDSLDSREFFVLKITHQENRPHYVKINIDHFTQALGLSKQEAQDFKTTINSSSLQRIQHAIDQVMDKHTQHRGLHAQHTPKAKNRFSKNSKAGQVAGKALNKKLFFVATLLAVGSAVGSALWAEKIFASQRNSVWDLVKQCPRDPNMKDPLLGLDLRRGVGFFPVWPEDFNKTSSTNGESTRQPKKEKKATSTAPRRHLPPGVGMIITFKWPQEEPKPPVQEKPKPEEFARDDRVHFHSLPRLEHLAYFEDMFSEEKRVYFQRLLGNEPHVVKTVDNCIKEINALSLTVDLEPLPLLQIFAYRMALSHSTSLVHHDMLASVNQLILNQMMLGNSRSVEVSQYWQNIVRAMMFEDIGLYAFNPQFTRYPELAQRREEQFEKMILAYMQAADLSRAIDVLKRATDNISFIGQISWLKFPWNNSFDSFSKERHLKLLSPAVFDAIFEKGKSAYPLLLNFVKKIIGGNGERDRTQFYILTFEQMSPFTRLVDHAIAKFQASGEMSYVKELKMMQAEFYRSAAPKVKCTANI